MLLLPRCAALHAYIMLIRPVASQRGFLTTSVIVLVSHMAFANILHSLIPKRDDKKGLSQLAQLAGQLSAAFSLAIDGTRTRW